VRSRLGILLLVAQLVWVIYAHFFSWRYFAWAPNDYLVQYTIDVTVDGQPLSAQDIGARYREDQHGRYEAPARHLIDQIRQYEQTYGRSDRAEVVLRYRLNSGEEQIWKWP
jgi:hypothetical protein